MATAFVRDIDGHVMLQLAPETVAELALAPDASVEVEVENGTLIVQPYRRRKYTMTELLADYGQIPRNEEEDREWLNSPPVGRELL